MNELFTGSIALSLLHAAIPNHWLPIVAIGRRAGWSAAKTLRITVLAGSAHALSTVFLGLFLGLAGFQVSALAHEMMEKAGPVLLIVLGAVFVYRHYFHKHFHLHGEVGEQLPERQLIVALALAMFLSPCLEIGAFFLLAGTHGANAVVALGLLYTVTTVGGMAIWVQLVWRGLSLANWHTLEHNAGLLSGGVLMLTGLAALFWGH